MQYLFLFSFIKIKIYSDYFIFKGTTDIKLDNCFMLFIKRKLKNEYYHQPFMVPIYEQIVDQIKTLICKGELKENDNLPSVRTLSKTIKINVFTVKKAYDTLVAEGFTVTIHGTRTYIAAENTELLLKEQKFFCSFYAL